MKTGFKQSFKTIMYRTPKMLYYNKKSWKWKKKITEAQRQISIEQQSTEKFWKSINGSDEDVQKDMAIILLKKQTEELQERFKKQSEFINSQMEKMGAKISQVASQRESSPQSQLHTSGLNYKQIQEKMQQIQKQLFDPNIDERESESLNIEYEKLVTELESTKEYQVEQAAVLHQWKLENVPMNKEALEKLRSELSNYPPMKKAAALKRKPELKFLDCSEDQIMKKHVNDFKGLTTQNLTLEETRALYACLPEFRKDQEIQLAFVSQLKEKIEYEMKKPKIKPPPPIQATKIVVINNKSSSSTGEGDGFLEELVRRRKLQG